MKLEARCVGEAHTYDLFNGKPKCEGIPVFQGKMSVQSMLATWDFGIMMEHENFGFLPHLSMEMTYLVMLVTTSLIRNEYWQEMTTKSALTQHKLNNNQGFSEPLSKQFLYMNPQSIPFPANFEQ